MPGRSIGWDLHTPDDPAAAPSHWQRYGFDGAGRLNAVSSPSGEYSYTYVDQSHLLASVTGPVHTVTNSYESGRDAMTSKTNAVASSTVSRFGARYDALGRSVETSRSGSAFAQNFVSDYQYDLLGQLTKDERFAGEVPGDPAAKLEGESFSFLYDGIGNRLTAQKGTDTTAYTPNALNQYTDVDGIEPVYDADGNLFSDGKNRLHWDAENRLTLVEPLVATEGSKRLEFKYDYIGRRVSKQVWTHTGGAWTDESTTAFVYDGWNLIEEISTSSQTASINHYTWGLDLSGTLQGAGGVGGLLALSNVEGLGQPQTFHYTFDLNGNVSELLDSSGSIAAHYEYGPFGELLRETYPSSALSEVERPALSEVERSLLTFNFSTKYYDAALKTYYYGYRYYDPTHGRWLNRDPIEESGGLNLYGFVGNDAVNRWDLWGMAFQSINDLWPVDLCCEIELFVAGPYNPQAVTNGVINLVVDTGHTWLELRYTDLSDILGKTVSDVISFGPVDSQVSGSLKGVSEMKNNKRKARLDYPIDKYKDKRVDSMMWQLEYDQCESAKRIFQRLRIEKPAYGLDSHCTTLSLEILRNIPVSPTPPDGIGPAVVFDGISTLWSGDIPNPYHLSIAIGGTGWR